MPFIFTTLNYNFSLNFYVMKLETFLLLLYKFTFFSKKKKVKAKFGFQIRKIILTFLW